MYDHFGDSARAVVVSAEREARSLQHGTIRAAHLLLGVLMSEDLAVRVVTLSAGLPFGPVREHLRLLVAPGAEAVAAHPRVDATFERVIEHASSVAERFGDGAVEPKHLLLGIIAERDEIVDALFVARGEDLALRMRNGLIVLLRGWAPPAAARDQANDG